jgi:hypothetical protein
MPLAGASHTATLVITTATLRDATARDEFVDDLGLAGPAARLATHGADLDSRPASSCTFSSTWPG